jgi:phenylacetate-CoA ligase
MRVMNHNPLNTFQSASKSVPAYIEHLKANNIDPSLLITSIDNFRKLPPIDKSSYILKYPSLMLFPNGKFPAIGHTSSGSSGNPTFWFRDTKQEKIGIANYRNIFKKIFNIQKNEPTLVIICFSMGIWVAGTYTLIACRELARLGHQLTILSPGIETRSICEILKTISPYFKRVILIGYPSFIKLAFEEIHKNNIPIHKNICVITSGNNFSEGWRSHILKQLEKPKNEAARIINIYGCSDAGILGHETPLSIFIRQYALQNKEFCNDVFGLKDVNHLPSIIQYNPKHIYFEEVNGELLLTANIDMPLIRYNIHDRGRIISFKEMRQIMGDYGIGSLFSSLSEWKLPFATINGRTDVAVTFNAVNIFPENIQEGLRDPNISYLFSGNFLAYTKELSNHYEQLHLDLELAEGIKNIDHIIKQNIQVIIVENIKKTNSEYRDNSNLGYSSIPIIHLSTYGDPKFKTARRCSDQKSLMLSLEGGKTRIITDQNKN